MNGRETRPDGKCFYCGTTERSKFDFRIHGSACTECLEERDRKLRKATGDDDWPDSGDQGRMD